MIAPYQGTTKSIHNVNYLITVWAVLSDTHFAPLGLRLLGGMAFLHTFRPSGAIRVYFSQNGFQQVPNLQRHLVPSVRALTLLLKLVQVASSLRYLHTRSGSLSTIKFTAFLVNSQPILVCNYIIVDSESWIPRIVV